ncbi:hypothetical protein NL676_010805 [Syzygium grande]|nr:hypothetical protein NL676_010805 [Syzygium grande]
MDTKIGHPGVIPTWSRRPGATMGAPLTKSPAGRASPDAGRGSAHHPGEAKLARIIGPAPCDMYLMFPASIKPSNRPNLSSFLDAWAAWNRHSWNPRVSPKPWRYSRHGQRLEFHRI